jgi:hypothetical protein
MFAEPGTYLFPEILHLFLKKDEILDQIEINVFFYPTLNWIRVKCWLQIRTRTNADPKQASRKFAKENYARKQLAGLTYYIFREEKRTKKQSKWKAYRAKPAIHRHLYRGPHRPQTCQQRLYL